VSIHIVLADDHEIVREGLSALLSSQSGIEVVGFACNGHEAIQLVHEQSPDLVVMDVAMPDMNGIEATRQMLRHSSEIKVLALSVHSDKRFIVEMLKAGASGYLLKDCAFDELAHAIEVIMSGQIYLSPSIAGVVVDDYMERISDEESSVFSVLTTREREVLQLLTEGHSTKDVAGRLHLSVKTIETHRQNIMNKLNIHTLAELTKYAIREGLTSLEP